MSVALLSPTMGTTNIFVNEHEKGFYQETLTKTDVLYQWFSQETFTRETCIASTLLGVCDYFFAFGAVYVA
jgi:hypothetical protein